MHQKSSLPLAFLGSMTVYSDRRCSFLTFFFLSFCSYSDVYRPCVSFSLSRILGEIWFKNEEALLRIMVSPFIQPFTLLLSPSAAFLFMHMCSCKKLIRNLVMCIHGSELQGRLVQLMLPSFSGLQRFRNCNAWLLLTTTYWHKEHMDFVNRRSVFQHSSEINVFIDLLWCHKEITKNYWLSILSSDCNWTSYIVNWATN